MPEMICKEATPEWLERRREGLGGSDAPAILGIHPNAGPAKIAAIKLGYTVEDDAESELLRWGHYVEAPLIQAFRDETGLEATLRGVMYRSTDPSTPFMQATIDGDVVEAGEVGGIQCKLAIFTGRKWEIDGTPPHVVVQVQHEMAVMDWSFCYVLVLIDGYKPRWDRIDRDGEWLADVIVPAEAEFWAKLQAGEPIAPKGSPDGEWLGLKARFPTPEPGTVALLRGERWIEVVRQWREASEAKTANEKAAKAFRNEIVAEVGSAEYGQLDDGTRVSLKLTSRKAFATAASSFRMLRLVGGKSDD